MNTVQKIGRDKFKQEARERYSAYLQSDHWFNLKTEKVLRGGQRCENCPSQTMLHVHHINYRDLYDCTLDDLMVLCQSCHADFHEAIKVNRTKPNHYTREETCALIRRFRKRKEDGVTFSPRKEVNRAFRKCVRGGYRPEAISKLITDLQVISASFKIARAA